MADLQLDEHMEYQRKFWRIQRAGWALLLLLLALSALGLLGSGGPLHEEVLGAGSGFRVEHPRVQRLSSEFTARFELAGADSLSLILPRRFFENHRVEEWTPDPVSTEAVGDEVRLTFDGSSAILHARSQSVGRKSIPVRTEGGEQHEMSYLVLP